ncbi:hypothetical protein ACWEN4_28280 [Streptomyces violaceorubidus]
MLLIAVNLYRITSDHDRHRARVNLRLVRRPDTAWQIIVPLNQPASPFRLRGDELSLNGTVVAHVERIDADDAVGGYFRDGGRAATFNPNARSRCIGYGWCPNTPETAADPRVQEDQGLDAPVRALRKTIKCRAGQIVFDVGMNPVGTGRCPYEFELCKLDDGTYWKGTGTYSLSASK